VVTQPGDVAKPRPAVQHPPAWPHTITVAHAVRQCIAEPGPRASADYSPALDRPAAVADDLDVGLILSDSDSDSVAVNHPSGVRFSQPMTGYAVGFCAGHSRRKRRFSRVHPSQISAEVPRRIPEKATEFRGEGVPVALKKFPTDIPLT
jgi:hypothetical protein